MLGPRNYSIKPSYKPSLKELLNQINNLQDVFTSYKKKTFTLKRRKGKELTNEKKQY